jgi:hypothetical protein
VKEIEGSSTISHIGHENGVLSVKFKSNPKVIYDYPDVSEDEHKAFMEADSKGSHHHKNFKGRPFSKREET